MRMNDTESAEVDLPFKMRALGNFIRKLVCTGEPGDPAEIQAQACDEAADEIERLRAKIAGVDARINEVVAGRVMGSTSWLRDALAELRA